MVGPGLVALLALQGQAGVFPARTVLPLAVAAGGNVAASGRLGALTLNPASAAAAKGIEVGVTSYPLTGLEGTSLAAAGGARLRVAFGLWSFAVKDIIDDDLVAVDPSLGQLSASSIGVTLGAAFAHRGFAFGVSASHRAQSIVGLESSSSAVSLGSRVEAGPLELGVSLLDIPLGAPDRDIAPSRTAVLGAATTWEPSKIVALRLELNAYAPGGRVSTARYGGSIAIRIGNFEALTGHSAFGGWGVGGAVAWKRLHVEAATSLVARDRMDRRVAFSVGYR